MKEATTTTLLAVVYLGAMMGSVLDDKAVYVFSTDKKTRLNDNFIEKLKKDVKANPDKYGPEAQKIGNSRVTVRAYTSVFTSQVAEKIAETVDKLGTSVSNGGWNL